MSGQYNAGQLLLFGARVNALSHGRTNRRQYNAEQLLFGALFTSSHSSMSQTWNWVIGSPGQWVIRLFGARVGSEHLTEELFFAVFASSS